MTRPKEAATLTLAPPLRAIFRALVEEAAGLHYREEDSELFSDKIHSRMRDAGFENALDYYYRLRYDDPDRRELHALVDALVVGETYFFRELDALYTAIEHFVMPAIAARGAATIWSAACATGEEPLTLAMLLAEAKVLDRCRIRATDVSHRAILRAREARYRGRSLRLCHNRDRILEPTTLRVAERWLEITRAAENGDAREAHARAEILSVIEYRQENLLGLPTADEVSSFDLILCRNVLIYFSDDTIRRVVTRLGDALRPGHGRLLVGASESLLRFGTRLQCEERGGSFFYAKARSA